MGIGLNSGGGPSRGYTGGLSPQGPLMSQMNTGVSGGSVSSYSVQTTGASSFTDMNAAAAETSGCSLNGRGVEELLRDGGILLRVLAHR